MKKYVLKFAFLVLGIFLGTAARVAFAATSVMAGSFRSFVDTAGNWLSKTIIPIIVAIAVLYFFYNLIFYILNSGNEKERENFKTYSINALLALFVLLCVWGIVGIFTNTFFQKQPVIPQLPTSD